MEEWKKYKVGDICKTNIAQYSAKENWDSVTYLDTGNITRNKINALQLIDDVANSLPIRAKRKVKHNDIIYSTVRPDQCHFGILQNPDDRMLVSTGFTVITTKDHLVHPFFLYYCLTQQYITNHLHSIGEQSVSTYPSIKPIDIESLYIYMPSLPEQKRIADILKSLDDKIELNRQINDNLEQQARALFKSWFVDFEPFKDGKFVDSELGLIPEGWRVGTLGDYCKVKSGFAFKSAWWQEKGIKVIKIKNIGTNHTLDLNDCSYVSEDKMIFAKDSSLLEHDLLIAMTGATIGKFTIVPNVGERLLVNQRVGKFFLGNNPVNKLPFLYLTLKLSNVMNDIINRGQGSAQPNISPSDIEAIEITIPHDDILDDFNCKMKPIFKSLTHFTVENQNLERLRDALLPKLMSGELKINDLNS